MSDLTADWPRALQAAFRAIYGGTSDMRWIPECWRALVVTWTQELAAAGAIESGVYVLEFHSKYNTLRADLRCPSGLDPIWDAFEVSLEDRSEPLCDHGKELK